jgi:hypothetical protein
MHWVAAFFLWIALSGLAGAKPVEPEVRTAFEEALGALPTVVREQVKDVKLRREADLGLQGALPLEYRLLNRAAYASMGVVDRELRVYDACVLNRPFWGQAPPEPAELSLFLAGVADLLGVEAPEDAEGPALAKAWEAFAERVYSWRGETVPIPLPPPGAPEVLDRFLKDGVGRALDGQVPMVQMLVHELGHALQLDPEGGMVDRMLCWATLSGFVETSDHEKADGFVGGGQSIEHAQVLIRLILADEPDKSPRGPMADYQPSSGARFVNRYGRYDLREDYAECFRLMVFDPERLARLAPEKFLYLNALGWNARLDVKNPGPLWYSGETFARLLPKSSRRAVFERLLGTNGQGPALHEVALAAVLRAHAEELAAEDLPPPYALLVTPDDLPGQLRASLDEGMLTAEVDGIVHVASPELQRARQDEMIAGWLEFHQFSLGLLAMMDDHPESIRKQYLEDVVKVAEAEERAEAYERLREYGKKLLPAQEWRQLDHQESNFQQQAGRALTAERFAILAQEGNHQARITRAQQKAEAAEAGLERVRLFATAADVALETGDPQRIRQTIQAIPGETLGAWMRTQYWLRAALETGQAEFAAQAEQEVEKVGFPRLKGQMRSLLAP